MRNSTLLLLLILATTTSSPAAADNKKLVVVVAKGSHVTSISRSDLKHCFLGDSISAGDETLVPFNSEAGKPERVGFDRAILGMTPDEVGKFWVNRRVRGEPGAPRSLPSNAYVAKVAAKFRGAISYLPADQLTADVQAVAIDGVVYTDPHYNVFVP